MKSTILTGLLALALLAWTGCNKEPQLDIDVAKIQDYLSTNGLEAESLDSGLHYIIKAPGSGDAFPSLASDITINYKGYLLDGTVFDENTNITFALNRLIRGWQEGIPLIKPGGEIMLLIPSELGYGANRSGSIPGNSVLIFEIDLISFTD